MSYEMFWSMWIAIAVGASVALGLGMGVFLGLRWQSPWKSWRREPKAKPEIQVEFPATRNVDAVFIGTWRPTDQMPRLRQFAADVTLQWTDVEGGRHEHMEKCLWPDLFWELDGEQQQEIMEQAAMATTQTSAGVDRHPEALP